MARSTVHRWLKLGFFEDGPPEIRICNAMVDDIERAMNWYAGEKVRQRAGGDKIQPLKRKPA